MRDFNVLREEARFLNGHLSTIWDDYDHEEKSNILEKRVPKIQFSLDVEWMYEDIHHFMVNDSVGQYVRECQVSYNGNTYIFEISTFVQGRSVMKYQLDVFTPAGDGKGGKFKLFTERI